MSSDQLEKLFPERWRDALRLSRTSQARDDLQKIFDYVTWDDVQAQIVTSQGQSASSLDLTSLKSGLLKLQVFTDVWMDRVGQRLDTSPLYGFIKLLLELVQQEQVRRVPPMMSEILSRIGILNSYLGNAPTFTTDLKESCITTAVSVLEFLAHAVRFIRNNLPVSSASSWRPLEDKFQVTIKRIEEQCSRVKTSFRLTLQLNRSVNTQTMPIATVELPRSPRPAEEARLPCIMLPDIRTTRFFDRQEVIEKIDEHFSGVEAKDSFRSLAIHGLGGVGKSTVALKYADLLLRREQLDALFWVHSEKLVSIRQSFTQIATRLKLPGAQPGDDDENKELVLNWLQKTSCRWLIVYDNADDPELLRHYWPLASRGQALITTRNFIFGYELADKPLEIPNWDSDTGLRFLLSLLSSEIGQELQGDEFASAQQLSQRLQGHALAIATMAGVMHRRALTITEFMNFYNQYPGRIHDGISGNRSINTLWEISFQSLDPAASAVLGVMAYTEPDSIPHQLFEPSPKIKLPERFRFCVDHFQFSAAIEDLLTQGLLKKDRLSRSFSLHRLVQTAFRHFMTPEQRLESFQAAVTLVSDKFPYEGSTGNFYLVWETCALYLQHVISLKDNFLQEHRSDASFSATVELCELNSRCQRYLLETNSHRDLADLIEVNNMAMSTIPAGELSNTFRGALYSHRGQLLTKLGKGEEGVVWLKKSYEMFSLDLPDSLLDVAWAADNAATGIATINKFEAAMPWYDLARDQYIQWSKLQPDYSEDEKENWNAVLKTSIARGWFWGGRHAEARKLATESLQQVERTKPYSWNLAAGTHHLLGTIERHGRNYDLADSHFIEAQNLWIRGDRMKSDPFYGSCLYRQGCVALDQGRIEAAIKHLRDALAAAEKRKTTLVAEYMRCLFKLSEALEQDPRSVQEARLRLLEAEHLFRRQAPEVRYVGKEHTYDSLVALSWR